MKRLAIAILAVVLSAGGISGCAYCSMDDGEGWMAQDGSEWAGGGGGDITQCDPEIEARAEMY